MFSHQGSCRGIDQVPVVHPGGVLQVELMQLFALFAVSVGAFVAAAEQDQCDQTVFVEL